MKARTSLAAARMHSSGCRTPVCRVVTWRFGGTAKSRCCPTSTPPTEPRSTNAPVQEWQLADGDVIRLGHSEIVVHIH